LKNSSVMLIAAEASSAQYALKLMQYWKSQNLSLDVFGVGSSEMELHGQRRIGKSEDMAIVGLAEVIAHYADLKLVFNNLIDEARRVRPKFVLLMDYPDFNIRLAKKLKSELGPDIKIFYYISPQIWAWRKNRIHDIKKCCDKVFLLFPFEKIFYDQYQVPNEFVGHPLLEDLDSALLDQNKIELSRQKYGIQNNEFVLALMPGSRKSEIEFNFQTQLETAKILLKKYKKLRLMIFVAPTLSKDEIQSRLNDFGSPYILIKENPNQMISMAHLVLATSGTATLMVGLLQKPMVIMYKMKWITGVIAKVIVRGVKFFGLVNLIMDQEIVPERFQNQANPEELSRLLSQYIDDHQYYNNTVNLLSQLQFKLGDKGATQRVGSALMKYLE